MSLVVKIRRYIFLKHLRKSKVPFSLWHKTIAKMPLMQRYGASERIRIRLLASEILRRKSIIPVQGMILTDEICIKIATQAAILVVGLESFEDDFSLDWLRNWNQIIVYPEPFRNGRENLLSVDGFLVSWAGVESGETSYQGQIIIDWQDDQPHALHRNASQVLMHELAHKLDMLDGNINGHPPLHANVNEADWFEAFETAYEDLTKEIKHGKETKINPYAATSPAEFFAVATEYFFESPQTLEKTYPKVYQQLVGFYRQNPLEQERTRV